MRVLVVGSLFPSGTDPLRGVHNHQRVLALAGLGHEVRVVAPVPWFPLLSCMRSQEPPPRSETLEGLPITHPRFFRPPRVAVSQHHRMYRAALRQPFAEAVRSFNPDVALLLFGYPDAVAMAPLCQEHGLPWVVAVLGSDFRVRCTQPSFRSMIMGTLHSTPVVVCPGQVLRGDLLDAGLAPDRVIAFNNGINHDLFYPGSGAARRPVVIAVGGLVQVKGLERLIAAWGLLRDRLPAGARLELLGDGPRRHALAAQARRLGVGDRVEFLGALPHAEVANRLRQAHCLCLPSRSEGMPNVVIEALACGTPVVATDVGEVPFLVQNGEQGETVANRDESVAADLAEALSRTLARSWDPEVVRARVARFTWDEAAKAIETALAQAAQTWSGPPKRGN